MGQTQHFHHAHGGRINGRDGSAPPAIDSLSVNTELLTIDEAADVLRCSRRTIERRIAFGNLAAIRNGRRILISVTAIRAFVASNAYRFNAGGQVSSATMEQYCDGCGTEDLDVARCCVRLLSPGQRREHRASVRLDGYRMLISAPSEKLLNGRVENVKRYLVKARGTLGALPPGLEAELRTDGTPRYTATVGRGRTRVRLRTDSLEEAIGWHAQRRAEIEARRRTKLHVSLGPWSARWYIPAGDDPKLWEEREIGPLLRAHAHRVGDLPSRVRGNVLPDGSVRYVASVEVGAHRRQRSFSSLREGVAWQAQERQARQAARRAAQTGHTGVRRVFLNGGDQRFKVRVEVCGLVASQTHPNLDAAIAARDRLQRELSATARTLRHPWRVRVRYRADGSAIYYARICQGSTVMQRRCASAAEAEAWLSATAHEHGLREGPVEHLWDADPVQVISSRRTPRRSAGRINRGSDVADSERLWDGTR
jgi:excisionase family DNA binding protein